MSNFEIYGVLIIELLIFYGIPFLFYRSKKKVYYSIITGTVIYYLFCFGIVYFMDLFDLDDGTHSFFDLILISVFISLPFVFFVSLGIILSYYIYCRWLDKIQHHPRK